MQEDFHYYATYCAAYIAGYSNEESLDIAYSAQFVDVCSRTLLAKIKGPSDAATTQLQLELMDAVTDRVGLQDITRIWASFHFLNSLNSSTSLSFKYLFILFLFFSSLNLFTLFDLFISSMNCSSAISSA